MPFGRALLGNRGMKATGSGLIVRFYALRAGIVGKFAVAGVQEGHLP